MVHHYWKEYDFLVKADNGVWPTRHRAMPLWTVDHVLEGGWLPCACCVEWDERVGRYVADASYFQDLRDHEDGMYLNGSVLDLYWSCPHAEVFYGPYSYPCYIDIDGAPYKSWADIFDEAEERRIAAAGGLEVLKKAEEEKIKAAVTLDASDPNYILKHVKKMEVDEEYKESVEMQKWLQDLNDKKRSAGRDWALKEVLACKYGTRPFWNDKGKQEKVITYEFYNPLLAGGTSNSKAKHFYAECWAHEYVDPKTKQRKEPHTCNCFHPGQKGWKDEWLWDPASAWIYDRFKEDWFKYYYHPQAKQWCYDNKRTLRDADRVRLTKPNEGVCDSQNRVRQVKAANARETSNKAEEPKTTGGASSARETSNKAKAKAKDSDDGWHTVLAKEDMVVSHQTVWEVSRKNAQPATAEQWETAGRKGRK